MTATKDTTIDQIGDALKKDLPTSMLVAAFFGAALYIAIELFIRLGFTFTRHNSVFHWSTALAALGVLLSPLFIILSDYGIWTSEYGTVVTILLSWWLMVAAQSAVLWSRLHLVMGNLRHYHWIGWILFATSMLISIPTIVFRIVARTSPNRFDRSYLIWDKCQITLFFIQETLLASIYIYETSQCLRRSVIPQDPKLRIVHRHLIWTIAAIVCLDISLQGISFASFFHVASAYKVCVYAIKLRMAVSILSRLTEAVKDVRKAQLDENGIQTGIQGGINNRDPSADYFPGGRPREMDRFSHHSDVQMLVEDEGQKIEPRVVARQDTILKTIRIEAHMPTDESEPLTEEEVPRNSSEMRDSMMSSEAGNSMA